VTTLAHKFVEFIPNELEERVLYVSLVYGTASHRCCCGCGIKVVTPLTPTDWKLIFDGETVSLYPSIGNWSFPCRSHYWIRNNGVEWADDWSERRIDAAAVDDRLLKERHYHGERIGTSAKSEKGKKGKEFWSKIRSRWWVRR